MEIVELVLSPAEAADEEGWALRLGKKLRVKPVMAIFHYNLKGLKSSE